MANHPCLAKNNLPNFAQGRAVSIKLWEELEKWLNAMGATVKNAIYCTYINPNSGLVEALTVKR